MSEEGMYREADASELAKELFGGKLEIGEALEKLRMRLLDLTMRNKLLNYKAPKGRSFQFTNDADLDLLFERLEEGKAASLAYVPDPLPSSYEGSKKPDVRAYAREQGIGVSVDIAAPAAPTSHRRLPALQVLMYPADLERYARKLASEAHAVVDETGTNMLHLMFGFLEYFDSDASDKPVHAPLLSMPVSLQRGSLDPESRTYTYDLRHSGEDIAENFTLREKLRQQFRLELPEIAEDELPESYFAKIQQAVAKKKNWTVKRRLSLGFLSFGKLAIWADLDPQKSESLLTSALLREIFEGGKTSGADGFHAEDYAIDSHAEGELPLIYDADSSQHSAIIDVKNGKSLVINGPPGTGKSQTITNIVATALAHGKKVLFVAEKIAALEVVKQRLESAGLGDFCLELHSNKTQKKQLLDNIAQRIAKKFPAPDGYAQRLEVLRERKKALNAYARLLSSREGNGLGKTIHEIFWATERRRLALGGQLQPTTGISIKGAQTWSAAQFDKSRVVLNDLAAAVAELGCPPPLSPWTGFFPDLLVRGDEGPVLRVLAQASTHLEALNAAAVLLARATTTEAWTSEEIVAGKGALTALDGVSPAVDERLLEQMFTAGVASVESAKRDVLRLRDDLGRVRDLRQRAAASLTHLEVAEESAQRFETVWNSAKSVLDPATHELTLVQLSELCAQLSNSVAALKAMDAADGIRFRHAVTGVSDVLLKLTTPVSAGAQAMPTAALLAAAASCSDATSTLRASLTRVEGVLRAAGLPFGGRVDELSALVDGRGLPELFVDGPGEQRDVDDLRVLAGGGWQEWTAEQFAAKGREIGELLAGASLAREELAAFFTRLNLPVETTQSGLESIETLLAAAEAAPSELLGHRTSVLETPEYAETAMRAEAGAKEVAAKASTVAGLFHLETLPSDDDLRDHVRALRQGDGFLNVFNGEWRAAKSAFKGCSKEQKKKLAASAMADRFSSVVAWKSSSAEFTNDEQFQRVLGGLFNGVATEFAKVRRLHGWAQAHASSLLASEYSEHVHLATVPGQHITLLVASAPKVRAWVGKVRALSKTVSTLPGLDPALTRVRRIDELFAPLDTYVKTLNAGGSLLRRLVRPTASVQRALELLTLRKTLVENGDLLRALVAAPGKLVEAVAKLGIIESPLTFQALPSAIESVASHAAAARELAEYVAHRFGDERSASSAAQVVKVLDGVESSARQFVVSQNVPTEGEVSAIVTARQEQIAHVTAFVELVAQYARPNTSWPDVAGALHSAFEARAGLRRIELDGHYKERFGDWLRGLETAESELAASADWGSVAQAVAVHLPRGAGDAFLKRGATDAVRATRSELVRANQAVDAYVRAMEGMSSWGRFDWTAWGSQQTPQLALERLRRAQEGAGLLVPWSKFLASKADAEASELGELVRRVEEGEMTAERLVDSFDYAFYRTLSRGILFAFKELARFTGAGHERLRTDFATLDKEIIDLNGALYASKIDGARNRIDGVGSGRAGDLTETPLLLKEINKQKKHIPIRQLLKRAGKTLQELKPVFMMGPLSVAQYLEQGYLNFDLIVMDEASQLRPEDALGAIARGRQLVVVGDPKQLPPSNFFDRLMDDDSEDPDEQPAVVDGVESILGICEHLYRPVRTLRWHYRSKHESLIAFSNAHFYDGRLVVFPSPYKRNKRLGVNYRYSPDGVYQDRRNIPEAQRVVDAVIDHMLNFPEESLGVVTLNQTQKVLIEDLLDEKTRNLKAVPEYLDRHEKAGWRFFVKNLENVQGDERDVIFVSTTFGRPTDRSRVRQNFGPLNQADGWRRLNVLFTRARRRLDLFTSMLPTDVEVAGKVSLGRRAMRDYLEYAKTGILFSGRTSTSGRDADSDFEVSVTDALRAAGYEAEPQVGVAGYFIDVGVRHPDRNGEFLAGIECDGATYHSSLSARDRDRIRQEVLESLGWRGRLIRVWSTDWFADPQGQTERLVQFLEQRRVSDEALPPPYVDEYVIEELVVDAPPEMSEAQRAEHEVASPPTADATSKVPFSEPVFVELGDRVTYETLDEPRERHVIQIVDSASNPKLNLVNEASPLAQALLGMCVGDETSFKVARQDARGLRVLKVVRDDVESTVAR